MLAASGCVRPSGGGETATTTATEPTIAGTVRVAGSSTVYPLTLRVGEQFASRYPHASVSVTSNGTGGGFTDFFCVGKTDLNDASRSITQDERERCASNGVEFVSFRVATDAVTVVVNNDADWIDCVTPEELATIWRDGGAERWSDVRPEWPEEPIEHFGPTAESGTFDYFAGEILGDVSAHRLDYNGTEQDATIIESVDRSEWAIGYLGFAYYKQNDEAVTALAVDDDGQCVKPSLSTAKSGAYSPLSRPLFVYVARDALDRRVVREFVRYYLDRIDTGLVSDVGYVPIDSPSAEESRSKFEAAVAAKK